jgi:hypothetical protein
MTRKDYELLAACFGASLKRFADDEVSSSAVWDAVRRVKLELELDNPRFDPDRFTVAVQKYYDKANGF